MIYLLTSIWYDVFRAAVEQIANCIHCNTLETDTIRNFVRPICIARYFTQRPHMNGFYSKTWFWSNKKGVHIHDSGRNATSWTISDVFYEMNMFPVITIRPRGGGRAAVTGKFAHEALSRMLCTQVYREFEPVDSMFARSCRVCMTPKQVQKLQPLILLSLATRTDKMSFGYFSLTKIYQKWEAGNYATVFGSLVNLKISNRLSIPGRPRWDRKKRFWTDSLTKQEGSAPNLSQLYKPFRHAFWSTKDNLAG